jgi:hypothetical protein
MGGSTRLKYSWYEDAARVADMRMILIVGFVSRSLFANKHKRSPSMDLS